MKVKSKKHKTYVQFLLKPPYKVSPAKSYKILRFAALQKRHAGVIIFPGDKTMKPKILLVEDDLYLREGLHELLTKENYNPICAANLAEALQFFDSDRFDLVILDVLLPDGNGLDLCTHIRNAGSDVPILFLTACDEEFQIVRGLDAGADDYVTKPFRLLELLSRIRALLRRKTAKNAFQCGDITLDTVNMTVRKGDEILYLTPTEYQILSLLMYNGGTIVTRTALLQRIWDSDGNFIDDNTLSVHISRLRDKIGAAHITTVRGTGYRWED